METRIGITVISNLDLEEAFDTVLDKFKPKMNTTKTKTMAIGKKREDVKTNIRLDYTELEQVRKFWYLGSTITNINSSQRSRKE